MSNLMQRRKYIDKLCRICHQYPTNIRTSRLWDLAIDLQSSLINELNSPEIGDRVELSFRSLDNLKQWSKGTVKEASEGEKGVQFDGNASVSVRRRIINSVGEIETVRVIDFCSLIK